MASRLQKGNEYRIHYLNLNAYTTTFSMHISFLWIKNQYFTENTTEEKDILYEMFHQVTKLQPPEHKPPYIHEECTLLI